MLKTATAVDVIEVATEEGTEELKVVSEAAGSDTAASVLDFILVEYIAVV